MTVDIHDLNYDPPRIRVLHSEDDANGAKIWRGDGGQVRVYVTRTLSRGRRQDMGFVSVAADGTASVAGMVRRKAAVRGWVDSALAGA